MGYLLGFITLIAFSSLISIEIVAARQYAAAWFPMLTQPGSSSRRCWAGWCSFCCSVSSSAELLQRQNVCPLQQHHQYSEVSGAAGGCRHPVYLL
jgi:hypothetical protein